MDQSETQLFRCTYFFLVQNCFKNRRLAAGCPHILCSWYCAFNNTDHINTNEMQIFYSLLFAVRTLLVSDAHISQCILSNGHPSPHRSRITI